MTPEIDEKKVDLAFRELEGRIIYMPETVTVL
jgi:hypothetical protein